MATFLLDPEDFGIPDWFGDADRPYLFIVLDREVHMGRFSSHGALIVAALKAGLSDEGYDELETIFLETGAISMDGLEERISGGGWMGDDFFIHDWHLRFGFSYETPEHIQIQASEILHEDLAEWAIDELEPSMPTDTDLAWLRDEDEEEEPSSEEEPPLPVTLFLSEELIPLGVPAGYFPSADERRRRQTAYKFIVTGERFILGDAYVHVSLLMFYDGQQQGNIVAHLERQHDADAYEVVNRHRITAAGSVDADGLVTKWYSEGFEMRTPQSQHGALQVLAHQAVHSISERRGRTTQPAPPAVETTLDAVTFLLSDDLVPQMGEGGQTYFATPEGIAEGQYVDYKFIVVDGRFIFSNAKYHMTVLGLYDGRDVADIHAHMRATRDRKHYEKEEARRITAAGNANALGEITQWYSQGFSVSTPEGDRPSYEALVRLAVEEITRRRATPAPPPFAPLPRPTLVDIASQTESKTPAMGNALRSILEHTRAVPTIFLVLPGEKEPQIYISHTPHFLALARSVQMKPGVTRNNTFLSIGGMPPVAHAEQLARVPQTLAAGTFAEDGALGVWYPLMGGAETPPELKSRIEAALDFTIRSAMEHIALVRAERERVAMLEAVLSPKLNPLARAAALSPAIEKIVRATVTFTGTANPYEIRSAVEARGWRCEGDSSHDTKSCVVWVPLGQLNDLALLNSGIRHVDVAKIHT